MMDDSFAKHYLEDAISTLRDYKKLAEKAFAQTNAVVAARQGDVNEALRLWRLKSNQDRRHLDGLIELSATNAVGPLREMYTQMKTKDPRSFVPDRALRLLQ